MSDFPAIDFIVPGEMARVTEHGVVSEDEHGRYALLKGVLPKDVSASPFEQTASAFSELESELVQVGMDFLLNLLISPDGTIPVKMRNGGSSITLISCGLICRKLIHIHLLISTLENQVVYCLFIVIKIIINGLASIC